MFSITRTWVSLAVCATIMAAGPVAGEMPASYTGTLLCEDCNERKVLLNLRADGVFHLRDERTFDDTDTTKVKDEIGVWELTEAGDTLLLRPTLGLSSKLAVGEDRTLMLVNLGHEVLDATHPLSRLDSYHPIEPRLFLRGKFSIRGDERVFRECVTGNRLIVEENGERAKLEEAYRTYVPKYGRDLLVSLVGRIVRDDGDPAQEMLIVEQYGGIWPVEVCGRWISMAQLEDTYWYLMEVGDSAFLAPMDNREPYLRLDSKTRQIEVDDGCNRLSGSYELDKEKIRFVARQSPATECPDIADAASAYRDAVQSAESWAIKGALLLLYDAQGNELAWFEPRFPPRQPEFD